MRFATKHAIIAATQLLPGLHMHTDLPGAAAIMQQHKMDNDRLMDILAGTSGKTISQVRKDFDRRVFFNAKQAMKYGFIDGIVNYNKA
jgi:ATP-dependent protease ClpP protease subunit